MTTTATHHEHDTTAERVLFMAFELRDKTWKLGFTTGHGQKPRERNIAARHQARLLQAVAQAKRRFGLPDTAPVVSCYEAGREGFWLHRFLQAHGITNQVVDSSSIEVNRRQRRAKSDGLDVRKLLRMLMRYEHGERNVWRVVHVPSVDAEDGRHLHRDLETLKQERASTTTRLKGLLSSQGIRLTNLRKFPEQLDALRLWDGSEMPSGLRRRLLRVWAHHQFLSEQITALEAERRALLHSSEDASTEKVRQLMHLKGIGINGSWVLVTVLRCCVRLRPWYWWRRLVKLPGPAKTPSERWGRLLQACSCRRKTQRESGDGWLHPHGEKVVGDARSQRHRKPPDRSRRWHSAPRECREEKNRQEGLTTAAT
jgi:transposase